MSDFNGLSQDINTAHKKHIVISKTKKVLTVVSVLVLGAIFGSIFGINAERTNTMTTYGQEAYKFGQTETLNGLWLEDTVGTTLNTPMDLSKISLPSGASIVRENDARLHCYYDAYNTNVVSDENTCFMVGAEDENFQYNELNKIIPLKSSIAATGSDTFTCKVSGTIYTDISLQGCLTLLRAETNKQYNDHILSKTQNAETGEYNSWTYDSLAYNPEKAYHYGTTR